MIAVDGVGAVNLSPTGVLGIQWILAQERAGRPAPATGIHPAARERLIGQGLIEPTRDVRHLQFTPTGWKVAYALEAAS